MKFPNLKPEELSELAKGIVSNSIFTSDHIREGQAQLIPSIFMPVAFGAFSKASKEDLEEIGFLYSNYSDAGPRSINGYPIFWNFKVCNKHDAKIVWIKVEKLQKMMDEI